MYLSILDQYGQLPIQVVKRSLIMMLRINHIPEEYKKMTIVVYKQAVLTLETINDISKFKPGL